MPRMRSQLGALSMKISKDNHTLEMRREAIEVTSNLPQPDPDWKFTDAAGHKHHHGTDPMDRYPTLVWEHTGSHWCEDCRDDHVKGHYICRLCREEVVPGTKIDNWRKYIPGMVEYLLDGEPISKEEAEAFIESVKNGEK
jgi:hypothetical protein